jgi:aspartyl-tRNA(Asn)/glutamyl-tRNA(Gln) amidotransferase subunit B
MNARAVEYAILAGLALNCDVASSSRWDRKNYHYPDLPKNYQISQYDRPLCADGHLDFPCADQRCRVRIRRAHLEEDAGKNTHDDAGHTLVDLNRAGTPLLEIVTEPDLRSAAQARECAVQLRRLVRCLGVSEASMQQGQMRIEPNVNVKITRGAQQFLTPIVEVKNLNSFHALHAAVCFEIERQVDEWEATGVVAEVGNKRNRGWEDGRKVTAPQREKEELHDYRYFPEPDLVPLTSAAGWLRQLRDSLPELPIARVERFASRYGLAARDAAALVDCRATADLLDAAAAAGGDPPTLGKHFLSFWSRHANERQTTIAALGLPAAAIAELANLAAGGTVNATSAAQIAETLVARADRLLAGRPRPPADALPGRLPPLDAAEFQPTRLAEELGLLQSADSREIAAWVDQALASHRQAVHDAVANTRKRKAARGFLMGEVMKLSGGKADPKIVSEIIETRLAEAVARRDRNGDSAARPSPPDQGAS